MTPNQKIFSDFVSLSTCFFQSCGKNFWTGGLDQTSWRKQMGSQENLQSLVPFYHGQDQWRIWHWFCGHQSQPVLLQIQVLEVSDKLCWSGPSTFSHSDWPLGWSRWDLRSCLWEKKQKMTEVFLWVLHFHCQKTAPQCIQSV